MISIVPIKRDEANAFVREHHRHHGVPANLASANDIVFVNNVGQTLISYKMYFEKWDILRDNNCYIVEFCSPKFHRKNTGEYFVSISASAYYSKGNFRIIYNTTTGEYFGT